MANTSLQPLRIAIVGAGQIGSAFAFMLAGGGHAVTVVSRPGSARSGQLLRDGAIVRTTGERAPVAVTERLDESVAYDLVIVTLQAQQIDAVLPALRGSATRSVLVMGNTFEPESLQAHIGAERCSFGMPFVQAMLHPDGRLAVTVGAGGRKTIMAQQRWVDLFRSVGIPAAREPDTVSWLRCHVPVCIAFQSVALAGMKHGGGATWREAMVSARGLRSGFALIRALGYDLYPRSKSRIAGSPTVVIAAVLWSVSRVRSFRELLATGRVECCALIDAMTTRAARAGTPFDVAEIAAMRPS